MDKKSKAFDRQWPELAKYVEYLNKHETLDKFALFSELDVLLERIKDELYTSFTQKSLDSNLKSVRFSRNLFSTKLLTRDLPRMQKYENEFSAKGIKQFLKRQAKRLKVDLPIPTDEELTLMEKTLPDLEAFYRYAEKRNDILATNTLNSMKAESEDVGILVTGGFHTDGITDYFKDKRITYVVISPQVDELDEDDTRYINALQGKKTPFERMIEEEQAAESESGDSSAAL